MDKVDLIVIGGGPAGYRGAEMAAKAGMSVTLFERRATLGGVCLNEGCIPTKTLLNSAKIYAHAAQGKAFGVVAEGLRLNHEDVVRRKNKVVKKLTLGVAAKMKAGNVQVIQAEARIEGRVDGDIVVSGGGHTLQGKNLLIAAGSAPVVPPIPGLAAGLESGFVMTSAEVLDMKTLPASLVVVGGGVIGLELAAYFQTAGVEVSVVEALDHVAGATQPKLAGLLQQQLEKRGVKFYLGCPVKAMEVGRVLCGEGERAKTLETEAVLLCIGRRAHTAGLGLEVLDIATERGAIVTDAMMRTAAAGVYAAGDCNGKSMLAHTAYREAEVAVNHMLGKTDEMRYGAVPAVIYTDPELATVGCTLEEALAAGINAHMVELPMAYAGRYVAETEAGTGVGQLVVDTGSGKPIGMHLLGSYASEMIWGAALALEQGCTVEDLQRVIFPHPTVSEIMRELLFEAE